jgi:hypothetical protein
LSWISPTGSQGDWWISGSNAYDKNTTTYALYPPYNVWTTYLILTVQPLTSGKVRFNAYSGSLPDNYIFLEVYKDNVWTEVYSGSFIDNVWEEKTFPTGSVSQARIKFYHSTPEYYQEARVYEFDFWGIVPAFYEGHYSSTDFDTSEEKITAYAEQIIRIFPKLQQYRDQIIKTLPKLLQYGDQLGKVLPKFQEYLDKLIKFEATIPAAYTGYDDQTVKFLINLSDTVDKCIKLLSRFTAYSDELVVTGDYSSDYSDSDFYTYYERFPGQIFRVSPRFTNYLDQTLKVLVQLADYSDKIIQVLPQLQDYVEKQIKVLPRLLSYSDEPILKGSFSAEDYLTTNYDVYRQEVPGQIFKFLPQLQSYVDTIIQFAPMFVNLYQDTTLMMFPRFTQYSDEAILEGAFSPNDYSNNDFDFYYWRTPGQIIKVLPRLQEFYNQTIKFVAEYETFEKLFIITVTRGEYDPLVLLYTLLRDNWSLTGDLSKDNLTFTTGWYDERISLPQLTVMPLIETGVPVETGKRPYYSQFYSLLINIWVRPKQDSGTSIGWAKSAQYRIRKEVERILKEGARLDTGPYEQFLTLRRWRGLDETDKRPVIFRQQLEVVDNFYRKS